MIKILKKDFSNIVSLPESTTFHEVPSYAYKTYKAYGTGSMLMIYDGGAISEVYTLIVRGDVDCDSAVDVIDAHIVSLAVNGHTDLTGNDFLAADTNSDGELTVEDYAQVVNLVLAG